MAIFQAISASCKLVPYFGGAEIIGNLWVVGSDGFYRLPNGAFGWASKVIVRWIKGGEGARYVSPYDSASQISIISLDKQGGRRTSETSEDADVFEEHTG